MSFEILHQFSGHNVMKQTSFYISLRWLFSYTIQFYLCSVLASFLPNYMYCSSCHQTFCIYKLVNNRRNYSTTLSNISSLFWYYPISEIFIFLVLTKLVRLPLILVSEYSASFFRKTSYFIFISMGKYYLFLKNRIQKKLFVS